jgi:FecR protein
VNRNRINELAASWSSEDPNPALRTELEELLRRDPIARRQFLDHCVGEMALVDSLASSSAIPVATATPQPLRVRPRQHGKRRTSRSNWWWVAGLVAAALVLGLIPLLAPGDQTPRITSGSLVVDNRSHIVGTHMTLPLINAKAGDNGVDILDPAGISVRAAPGSTFSISAPGAIQLAAGYLIVDVDHGRAPPTAVRTNELVANVTGTRFIVNRSSNWSEVEVERGHVRVSTPDQAVQELSAGAHIAADKLGFIIEEPSDQAANATTLSLILIAKDGTELSRHDTDQPIHLPANQLFTMHAEVSKDVVAMRFKLANEVIMDTRPDGLERISPFYLWGDFDWGKRPNFSQLPAGTHRLTITCFADERGARTLLARQITLIAE